MATDDVQQEPDKDTNAAYMTLLGGGILGGAIVLGSLISAIGWWGPFILWLRDGNTEKAWQPLAAVVALFTGLAIMFAAFHGAKRFERSDAFLRRVLYGYNTGLQLFLLFIALITIVTAVSFFKPLPYDTTEAGFFSLSEKTRKYLGELETPVTIYMLMDPGNPASSDMRTVLAQMEAINPRYFHFEELSTTGGASRARDLQRRFKQFNPRNDGLLVAYGEKPEDNHSYINEGELSSFDFADRRNAKRAFTGEVRLMQELQFLAEDKRRPIVYVTQGHGEPDLNDRTSPDGLAEFAMRLGKANFDVRPLTASHPQPEKNSVPADADLVMVIGPTRSMADMKDALEKYMEPADPKARKGKLVVLLGPTPPDRQEANMMTKVLGLEELLRKFGVNATREKVYAISFTQNRQPIPPDNVWVEVQPSATESRHPIAAMLRGQRMPFLEVRRLEAAPAAGPTNYRTEPLLVSSGFTWTEGNMALSMEAAAAQVIERDREKLSQEPRLVLAAVSESAGGADPHSAEASKQPTPRMIVCGCSTMASNRYMRVQQALHFDVIRGSIDWCRERSANVGIEPKSYQYFMLSKQTSNWNIFRLPLAAMALGVFGLGVIVWNIRRS